MAQYQTQLPDKQLLANKLHEFYALNAPEPAAAPDTAAASSAKGAARPARKSRPPRLR